MDFTTLFCKEGHMDAKDWDLDRSFFEETPPDDAGPLGLRVVRAPKIGKDLWTILSEQLIGCWTHYFQRRTQPCVGSGCHICSPKTPRRWYGWLVGFDPTRREQKLVEVPPGPALSLRAYRGQVGNLRGHCIELSRRNKKDNGEVVARFGPGKFSSELLPPCPDIVPLLMRMWQIKHLCDVEALDQELKIHPIDIVGEIFGKKA